VQDRPTADELLEAIREFLERDVMPVGGRVGFHGRVAANVVAILRRELALGPAQDDAERSRLVRLLGSDDVGDLRAANAELARLIRARALDDRRADVLDHLRATAHDKLAIANPGHRTERNRG